MDIARLLFRCAPKPVKDYLRDVLPPILNIAHQSGDNVATFNLSLLPHESIHKDKVPSKKKQTERPKGAKVTCSRCRMCNLINARRCCTPCSFLFNPPGLEPWWRCSACADAHGRLLEASGVHYMSEDDFKKLYPHYRNDAASHSLLKSVVNTVKVDDQDVPIKDLFPHP